MAGLSQYLQDTRAELRHVAWPTRTQTVVYAALVAAISVAVALYLGLFDFLFTSGLKRFVEAVPVQVQTQQVQETNVPVASSTIKLGDTNSEDQSATQ